MSCSTSQSIPRPRDGVEEGSFAGAGVSSTRFPAAGGFLSSLPEV